MEEHSEDMAYILLKSGLADRIRHDSDWNRSQRGPDKERSFWTRVLPETVRKINDVYSLDMEMFDYSFEEYLRQMGILERVVKK